MARLAGGPKLGGEKYPRTDAVLSTFKGKALAHMDLSLQGTLLTVEDAVLIGTLVEENDTLETLRLNSHKPLPIKALRGDEGPTI